MVYFVLPILFSWHWLLKEQFCIEMCCFPWQYFQLKDRTPVFQKSFFFFAFCKVRVMKAFKISSECHIKICRCLKRRTILKILILCYRGTYALCVGFKMKPLLKSFFLCLDKLTFCRKIWRKKQPSIFCLFGDSNYSKDICHIMEL